MSSSSAEQVKFVTKGRTYSSNELLTFIEREPKRAADALSSGLTIAASPAILAGVQASPFGGYLGDDGEVETSGFTGLEEALIVIAVVALFAGFGVGYLKGKEDGLEEAAGGEAETESESGGGESPGEGEGGTGEGGEGEGGEGERRRLRRHARVG